MRRSIAKLAGLLLAIATAAVSCGLFVVTHASCWPCERDALLAFKQGINDTNNVLASWQKLRHKDCCRWRGVVCSNETDHVIELNIGYTGLAGQISPSLLSLQHLEYLNLAGTSLLGPNGTTVFPEFLCSLHTLRHLDLSATPYHGRVPARLSNLSNLEYLNLNYTFLHGSSNGHAPEFLFSYKNLRHLALSNTLFSGTLPHQLTNCSKLEYLDLSETLFSGTLPPQLGKLSMLEYLELSGTLFSGTLPPQLGHVPRAICELKNLILLDLSNNLFEGEFPWCSVMPRMEYLILSNNNLSGVFPSWLQNSSSLLFLDLAVNKFSGTLPTLIGQLVNLKFLLLNHNMFYGDIPANITNLILLQYFSLASNNISGSIPSSLSKLIAMIHPQSAGRWFVQEYMNNGILSVVMKRQDLKYDMNGINEVVGIDLSLNHLTGGIPDEITSLNGLLTLNLSWNHLSGKIPPNIGAMKSLESLDLSRNNISGEIPTSLSDLTYLSTLDLSYDNLAGRIPTGRQLDTLYTENPSMYNGNIGLCGPPLEKNCPGNNPFEHGNQKTSKNGYDPVVFFYFGLTVGFVAGLWVVFCALLFKRAWRDAYFRLFDKLHDNVYVFVAVSWGKITSKTTTS